MRRASTYNALFYIGNDERTCADGVVCVACATNVDKSDSRSCFWVCNTHILSATVSIVNRSYTIPCIPFLSYPGRGVVCVNITLKARQLTRFGAWTHLHSAFASEMMDLLQVKKYAASLARLHKTLHSWEARKSQQLHHLFLAPSCVTMVLR